MIIYTLGGDIMKISNNLKENSIYLQKKDIEYLSKAFSINIVDDETLSEYKPNDFILIEGKEKVQIISSRDEILEFKDFLSMTKDQAQQRMDDAEQLYYIVRKQKSPVGEILRYRYVYESAVREFVEKEKGTLSFDVPLTLDMLNDYLFYDANKDYYAASTTIPSTYEIGRIDGDVVDINNPILEKFVKTEMTTASDLERKNITDSFYMTKVRNASKKKLYYTINHISRKK